VQAGPLIGLLGPIGEGEGQRERIAARPLLVGPTKEEADRLPPKGPLAAEGNTPTLRTGITLTRLTGQPQPFSPRRPCSALCALLAILVS
jgi:hypothetical protein